MHFFYNSHQFTKILLGVTRVFLTLVWFQSFQGCHQAPVGHDEEGRVPDKGGIPNLGNTCYMNAVLQVVAKLYPDLFDKKTGTLAETGRVVVDKIKDDEDFVNSTEIETFYNALLEETRSGWVKNRQEDVDECFTLLSHDSNVFPSYSIWNRVISADGQTIYDDWRSQGDHCPTTLKIYLPDIDHVTMKSCFQHSFRDEHLVGENQYQQGGESRFVDAIRQTRIAVHSNSNTSLAIQLVRFSGAGYKHTKNVAGTLELIVPSDVQHESNDNLCYRLQAFIVHSGGRTINSGHYVTYIDQLGKGQWTRYDDACVEKVTLKAAEKASQQAYLYFYRLAS